MQKSIALTTLALIAMILGTALWFRHAAERVSPYTLVVRHSLIANGQSNEQTQMREIIARSANGSRINIRRTYDRPWEANSPTHNEIELFDTIGKREVHGFAAGTDAAGTWDGAISTTPITEQQIVAAKNKPDAADCLRDAVTSKVIGRSMLLNGTVQGVRIRFSGRAESTLLPEYGCVTVEYDRLIADNGSRSIAVLESIDDHEPDPKLFQLSGTEMKPSDVNIAWRAHRHIPAPAK